MGCMPHAPDYQAEIAMLDAAIGRFCELPVPTDGPGLATFLQRVQCANDKLAVKCSEAGAAFAETDHYEELGFVSPHHWMKVNLHLTGGAASVRIAVGRQLANIP